MSGYFGGPVVNGAGPRKLNGWMIVGESPGEQEASRGIPFVGRAGHEQDRYLSNAGLSSTSFFRTLVCREYREGHVDPTSAQIAHWTPHLLRDIATLQPRIILAVGRVATRWFLGDDTDMEFVHGIPHRSDRAPNAVIMPCYHPAWGFYDDEARSIIAYDYNRAAAAIRGKISTAPPVDEYLGREDYRDVSGAEAERLLRGTDYNVIAIDTEGVPALPWSIQWSVKPGTGYTLRCERPDFSRGIDAIRRVVGRDDMTVVIQNAMYDYAMTRAMSLDLYDCRLYDTRYAAYVMRVEPQGLKPLAYRWCGMHQPSYDDTIGPAGLALRLDYLDRVIQLTHDWPKPEARIEYENDGTCRIYQPQPIVRRAEAILTDYYSGKVDKTGEATDPYKRWRKTDKVLRRAVEHVLGPMPIGTMADIPLVDAVQYASRDPDATLRLYYRIDAAIKAQGLSDLVRQGCDVIPIFEQMQSTGMRINREYMTRMSAKMWDEMMRIGHRISVKYYGGEPFNPQSPDKVAAIMRRRGLEGEKRSKKTGKMSTGKKSIEHLRYTDDAMYDIINWREHAKMRDSFYEPMLERTEDTPELPIIYTNINPYKVASRRISSSDPNLTAVPTRNELGVQVRDGFEADSPDKDPEHPDTFVYGSWDLSQIEMRYMAHESRDPLMIKFFNEKNPLTGKDFDIHAETAARIFGIPIADVQEMAHRYPSKRAGFGIITNIAGAGLYDQLRMFGCSGWSVEKCDDLIKEWLNVYKGVRQFLADTKRSVRNTGMVHDMWKMPRYLPGVFSDDKRIAAEAERAASSHKIQGGAQGMIQESMRWLKPYLSALNASGEPVNWVLQIHDEIILRFRRGAWDIINPLVVEALTEHSLKLIVPVKAKGSYSRTWGGLKG